MAQIPINPRANCYYGCEEGGPLHHFPKPDNDMERFNAWKGVLDNATKEKGNIYIYNQLRLCNKHFENYYKLPSNRLTKNAVPTLYIINDIIACPQVEVTPLASIELQRPVSSFSSYAVCLSPLS